MYKSMPIQFYGIAELVSSTVSTTVYFNIKVLVHVYANKHSAPCTESFADLVSEPTTLVATQVYVPTHCQVTTAICKLLSRLT